MILFSKRNINRSHYLQRRRFLYRRERITSSLDRRKEKEETRNLFLSDQLRSRLQEELIYLVTTGNYLEKLLILTREDGTFTLYKKSLQFLSKIELGYDITEILETRKELLFLTDSENYDDTIFFDLIELLIIFNSQDKREEFTTRLRDIFEEESDEWTINGYMIVDKSETGIRALVPLFKDDRLKELLNAIYENISDGDYKLLANASADALQYIFSAKKKKQTKSYTTQLVEEVAKTWTTAKGTKELSDLIDSEVKLAKQFNNKISELRHSDKHTIPVESKSLYKLIMYKNLSLIELIIQSTPEKYILDEDPNMIKDKYLQKYSLIDHPGWVIKPPEEDIFEGDDDIPF